MKLLEHSPYRWRSKDPDVAENISKLEGSLKVTEMRKNPIKVYKLLMFRYGPFAELLIFSVLNS